MKILLLTLFCISPVIVRSQSDSVSVIRICFLYDSKPKRAFKDSELKFFGGLHGGHVSIQYKDTDYGFEPTCNPIHLSPKKHRQSAFSKRVLDGQPRYSPDSKTVTFIIPLPAKQMALLDSIQYAYSILPPFDYAFFGMRCASATQHILGLTGILPKKSRFSTVFGTFYPRRLRKRLFRLAETHSYEIIRTNGKFSRKWESD